MAFRNLAAGARPRGVPREVVAAEIYVRPARQEDSEELHRLYREMTYEQPPGLQVPPQDWGLAKFRHRIAQYAESPYSTLLLAFIADQAAGFLEFQQYDGDQSHGGRFTTYVSPARRRRGVAEALTRELLRWVEEETPLIRVQAEALATNQASLAFCEKLGFEPEGVRRKAVRVGDGYVDSMFLSKLFER